MHVPGNTSLCHDLRRTNIDSVANFVILVQVSFIFVKKRKEERKAFYFS